MYINSIKNHNCTSFGARMVLFAQLMFALIRKIRMISMRILGIDPGYAITGYGIVDYVGNKFRVVDYGAITTEAGVPMPNRLLYMSVELNNLLMQYEPEAMAIEELFFSSNAKTAIAVGQGRGVALLEAARAGIDVFEYKPNQVKQAVAGYGRADKQQVQQMVKCILNLESVPKPDDTADALAIAICHAHSYRAKVVEALTRGSRGK